MEGGRDKGLRRDGGGKNNFMEGGREGEGIKEGWRGKGLWREKGLRRDGARGGRDYGGRQD